VQVEFISRLRQI
jgi:hypothetical protein